MAPRTSNNSNIVVSTIKNTTSNQTQLKALHNKLNDYLKLMF